VYADAVWTWAHIEGILFSSYAAALGILGKNIEPARAIPKVWAATL
jgi:hypothetical protein